MKNLPLRTKLIGSFLLVALLTVGVGIVGLTGLGRVQHELDAVTLDALPAYQDLMVMDKELTEIYAILYATLNPEFDRDERRALEDDLAAARAVYRVALNRYDGAEKSEEQARLWDELKKRLGHWAEANNRVFAQSHELLATDILDPVELQRDLHRFRGDHYEVSEKVNDLLVENIEFTGGDDATQCGFGKWLPKFDTTNPEIQKSMKEMRTHHDAFHAAVGHVRDLYHAGRVDDATHHYHEEMMPQALEVFAEFAVLQTEATRVTEIFDSMARGVTVDSKQAQEETYVVMDQLRAAIEAQTEQATQDAHHATRESRSLAFTGMIVAAILALALGWLVARMITQPVLRGVAFSQRMAQGDLTADLDIDQKDEIGQLAAAMNAMVARLRAVVSDVDTAASNVASGSAELSSSANKLSQGTTEQAASVEEVSSSMEQMAANIRQNTENSLQTQSIATQAAQDAHGGGSAVQETVHAMTQIAEKISVVEEIARQTNLLALNAAIEAARAGEHGKGFAVVAGEVRKLAERSGQAAAEIGELSASSVEVAQRAGTMLTKIVPDIQRTADLVQEIAASSREQDSGAGQINSAILQLDEVIQQNASAAEEMASTSEELASQSKQLQDTMEFFKV